MARGSAEGMARRGRSAAMSVCLEKMRTCIIMVLIGLCSCVCEDPWTLDCRGHCGPGANANPQYCGEPGKCVDCTARARPPHMTATCIRSSCSAACEYGWADCNRDSADGCETDLTLTSSCGACDNTCAAGQGCQVRQLGEWFCGHSCSEPAVQSACAGAFAHADPLCAGVLSSGAQLCARVTSQGKDPALWCPQLAALDVVGLQGELGRCCCGSRMACDGWAYGGTPCVQTCATRADCTDPARPTCAPALDNSLFPTGLRICVPNDGGPGHGCAGKICPSDSLCVSDPNGAFCALSCRKDVDCSFRSAACCNAPATSGTGLGCDLCR